MLNYDSILEYARTQGMPTNKIRGIIREYIQTLILKFLYNSKWADNFLFLGGTSLRLAYGLKRFSEDLDFNCRNLNKSDFENAAEFIRKELNRENIISSINFSHRANLYICEYRLKDILRHYSIKDKRGELMIKLETNTPAYPLKIENLTISSFGELFLINMMARDYIFADKIDTLRHKKRGRHLYDIIFMLSRKFQISEELLKINGIYSPPPDAIMEITNEIPDHLLEKLANELAPFLFNEEETAIIRNARIIIKDLLAKYI